jgi:hypothetical protein
MFASSTISHLKRRATGQLIAVVPRVTDEPRNLKSRSRRYLLGMLQLCRQPFHPNGSLQHALRIVCTYARYIGYYRGGKNSNANGDTNGNTNRIAHESLLFDSSCPPIEKSQRISTKQANPAALRLVVNKAQTSLL